MVILTDSGILDIYAISTDRHPENFGVKFYSDHDQARVKFAPVFDNECSLMLDQPLDEIESMLHNKRKLEDTTLLQMQLVGVPDEIRDVSYTDWEDTLFYLCDNSEECFDFAEKCSQNLDIKEAIASVESRIHAKLPEMLKEFCIACFDERKYTIEQDLNLDEVMRC